MSTTKKIGIKENKILKLNNVLIREVNQNEFRDINKVVYMMESYIKSKGNLVVGPLINHTARIYDENGQLKTILKLIVQLKNPINNTEKPYEFKTQLRVHNCLFARYIDKEENLQFAYSKLNVYAFENDIKLKGDSYTVFVDKKDKCMVADVFMEIQQGGQVLECL